MNTTHEEAPGGKSPHAPELPAPEVSERDKADAFWVELVHFTEAEHIDATGRDHLYSAYLQYQADLRALPGGKKREVEG